MRYKIGRDPADHKAEMLEARAKPPALPVYAIQTVDGLGRPLNVARPLGACGPCAAKTSLNGLDATGSGSNFGRYLAYGALALGGLFAGMILFQKK